MNDQEISLTSEIKTENIIALAAAVFNIQPDEDDNIKLADLAEPVTAFVLEKEAVTADFTMTVTNQDNVTFILDGLKATFNNKTVTE